MNRVAFSKAEVRRRTFKREYVPIISTILACMIVLLPILASSPFIPDFGFLMLISWRLLRPELWAPTTAMGLGLFSDIIAGHPIGQSTALWTSIFIIFDIIDLRLLFRDYWMDWFCASFAIISYILGGWYIGHLMGDEASFTIMLPQLGASILAFPIIARFTLFLDQWRLSR